MIDNIFRRPHPTDEELACFIDGSCSEHDRTRIAKHLRSCSRCSEAYREAVLYKGLWRNGASDFEPSEESIELARQVPEPTHDRKTIPVVEPPVRWFSFRPLHRRTIAIAASVIIIAAIGISYQLVNREGTSVFEQTHIAPVREAVEQASMNGRLVIPGGERLIGRVPEAYRSGYVRVNDSLGTALAYFAREFRDDKGSRAVMYWLLGGYIATGQINTARDLASDALETYPDDIDIMNLEAIISYLEGDTTSCERTLQRIIEREPDNPYANLNLAVLLSERGQDEVALVLLEKVIRAHGDSPFSTRARMMADEFVNGAGENP